MTLLFTIEYRTRWGEQLVLRLGKRRIACLLYTSLQLFHTPIAVQKTLSYFLNNVNERRSVARSEWRIRAVSYTHLDVYKRQSFNTRSAPKWIRFGS